MDNQSEMSRRQQDSPQPLSVVEPVKLDVMEVEAQEDSPYSQQQSIEQNSEASVFVRSKVELLAAGLGILYSAYLIYYFYGAWMSDDFTGWIAARLVTPHILCATLGAALSLAAFLSNIRWLALAGAVLYCAAAAVFPVYALQMLPLIVLSTWGCIIIWRYL